MMVFLLLFLSALGIGQAGEAQLASRLVTEGLGLAEQGRYEEAAARFRMAAQADPKNVDAHNNLGVTLRRRKDFQGAAAAVAAASWCNGTPPSTAGWRGAARSCI